MSKIVTDLRTKLKENADEKTRESGKHFFKESVETYGVKTALVVKLGKDVFKLNLKNEKKEKVFALCEELWKTMVMEESFIACDWSYHIHKQYEPSDLQVFEKWIDSYVNNWASCDTLCNHSVGALIEMYPNLVEILKKWAKSENRWKRRAAAVSLIVPAKKGLFLDDIFKIAEILLLDKEDLVQKGYGWMLKVASQTNEKEVFDFVMKNKKVMPRTALRYAIEKMPKDLKARAMEK